MDKSSNSNSKTTGNIMTSIENENVEEDEATSLFLSNNRVKSDAVDHCCDHRLSDDPENPLKNAKLEYNSENITCASKLATDLYLDENHEGEPKLKKKTVRTGWKRYLGIILALACSVTLPLTGLIVKALPEYHPFSITFWRFQGIFLPAIPTVVYYRCIKKEMIFDTLLPIGAPGRWKTVAFLVLRGAAGATAAVCMFCSLQYISLADTSVILFCSPVFVTFAAHIFLGENCGVVPIISGLFALAGMVVITRPPLLTGAEEFDKDNLIGAAFAVGGLVLSTVVFVVLRYLRQIHVTVLNLFFGFWGTAESIVLSLIIWKFQIPNGTVHWLLAVAMALITSVYQTCLVLALKFEQAGTVSLIRTCDVIFAFIWQFLILRIVPDRFSVIGASVVIFGMLLVGFRKWVTELPTEDKRRKHFWWILK